MAAVIRGPHHAGVHGLTAKLHFHQASSLDKISPRAVFSCLHL